MSVFYECEEHRIVVAGSRADDGSDDYVDEWISEHEQQHRDAEAARMARPYVIRHGDLGWTLTDERAEPGSRIHYLDGFAECVARLELLELHRLAGTEWRVAIPAGQVAPVYLVRITTGATTPLHRVGEAIRFLIAFNTEAQRRAELQARRDTARILADVAIDAASHLDVALAKGRAA